MSDPRAGAPSIVFEEDAAAPGWLRWPESDSPKYNAFLAPVRVRKDGEVARVRIDPRPEHANLHGRVHGGALLGFMDVALFAAARALDVVGAGGAVTVDFSAQFVGQASLGEALEARVELLRETGRLLFMRGVVVQDASGVCASFSGTVRKMAAR